MKFKLQRVPRGQNSGKGFFISTFRFDLPLAQALEKIALEDDYFVSRKLYPNVDFYSGLIYRAMNLPASLFTVMFAVPRACGWLAHWLEAFDDPEQKLMRPRQIYDGPEERGYVSIGAR